MCNYLYYWVTVRNSQSYWHLEHMGKTLACTRGGVGEWVARGGIRANGWMRGGGGGRGQRRINGGVWEGVFVCGGVRLGVFFDISSCYCIDFFKYPPPIYFQKVFSFFWFMKNNKE